MSRAQILGGYRRLLRASQKAFKGDTYALVQARARIRSGFYANAQLEDPSELPDLMTYIDETEHMLLYHIVQAAQTTAPSYQQPQQQQDDQQQQPERVHYKVKLTDPQKSQMRQDEELTPITPKSAEEPLVIRSGNACHKP